jgi:hypothetical protein
LVRPVGAADSFATTGWRAKLFRWLRNDMFIFRRI